MVVGHRVEIHPEAERLKRQVYRIFDAETAAQAAEHCAALLALRQEYVQALNQANVIFDFLERHWPKLVNNVGNDTIPAPTNTVELVIRRFDQHYQTSCGFESLQAAHAYLAVFEKVYPVDTLLARCPAQNPQPLSPPTCWLRRQPPAYDYHVRWPQHPLTSPTIGHLPCPQPVTITELGRAGPAFGGIMKVSRRGCSPLGDSDV